MRKNESSSTALLIAQSTYFLSLDPRLGRFVPSLSANASRWFVEDHTRRPGLFRSLCRRQPLRYLLTLLERLTLPGIQLHYALRKRAIDDVVRESIAAGFTQIVVLGAGFDTLALRMSVEFPDVKCIELDHPATQRLKMQSLTTRGRGEKVRFVAVDLSTQSLDVLTASGLAVEAEPTLFIAEGLFMYMDEARVKAILGSMTEKFPTVRCVFTCMELDRDGQLRFHNSSKAVDAWLRLKNEPFLWGSSRDALSQSLAECGFQVDELISHDELHERFLCGNGLRHVRLAQGEYICVSNKVPQLTSAQLGERERAGGVDLATHGEIQ